MMSERRTHNIIKNLKLRFPPGHFTEKHPDPFKILIATVLSQRTRDEKTDIASDALFRVYDTPRKLANADLGKVKRLIKPVGFYNQKSKRIIKISKILLEKYDGRVPANIETMVTLPGVGRKTANCTMIYGFHKPAMCVDTHVHRLSNRIGFCKTKTPDKTEQELRKVIPIHDWVDINELLVVHGQNICKPITPICSKCPISKWCDYYKTECKVKGRCK